MGTKAVDASLLLARMLVPEPMRPGWADTLRMSRSLLLGDQRVVRPVRLVRAHRRVAPPTSPRPSTVWCRSPGSSCRTTP
jgi:hypothetical protein